jgi:hypothetical protein
MALALIAMVSGCSPPARLTPAHRSAIIDSVGTMLADFRAAAGSLDSDSVARFYVSDSTFRWIEDGVIRYTSRDQIAAAYRGMVGSVTATRLLYDGTVITPLAPGVAAVATGFAQQFTMRNGLSGGFAGAVTAVVVHRAAGWQFLQGHTSSVGASPEPGTPSPDS